jgi:hypothetical protein
MPLLNLEEDQELITVLIFYLLQNQHRARFSSVYSDLMSAFLDWAHGITAVNRPRSEVLECNPTGAQDGTFPYCNSRPDKRLCCNPRIWSNNDWFGTELKVLVMDVVRAGTEMSSLRDDCVSPDVYFCHRITSYLSTEAGVFCH